MIAKPLAPVLRALGLNRMAAMLQLTPRGKPGAAGRAHRQGPCGAGRAPRPGGAALRLHRPGAGAVDQRGRHPPAQPQRHRGAWSPRARAAAARWSITWAAKQQALAQARNNIDAWTREIEGGGLDAILITVSGCGTDGEGLRLHAAQRCRPMPTRRRGFPRWPRTSPNIWRRSTCRRARRRGRLRVAYHAACSLQHGQKVTQAPKDLLCKFGFVVKDVPEGHLCCGSAGTYNILQPALAETVAGPQGRQYRTARAGCDRGRQYRLHHADRRRHRHPGRAYGRVARLGDRRAGAGRVGGIGAGAAPEHLAPAAE